MKGVDFMNTNSLSNAEMRWIIAEAQSLFQKALAYDLQGSDGHCFHGVYVGGCLADFMCGYCESGEEGSSHYDYLSGVYRYEVARSALLSARSQAKRLEAGNAIMALLDQHRFDEAKALAEKFRSQGVAYILR